MQRIRASWQLLGVLLLALLAMQQVLAVSVMRTQRATETTADAPELNVVTFNQVVGGNKAVLVDFYAPWCPHCMHFMPVMGQLAQQYASSNNVAVATVNAVASRELADSMGVTSYPTVKFFPVVLASEWITLVVVIWVASLLSSTVASVVLLLHLLLLLLLLLHLR